MKLKLQIQLDEDIPPDKYIPDKVGIAIIDTKELAINSIESLSDIVHCNVTIMLVDLFKDQDFWRSYLEETGHINEKRLEAE